MSFPLPEKVAYHFLDTTYRGFDTLQDDEKLTLKSNAQILSTGGVSEGRKVELAWIFDDGIFKKIRFKAFGDPYLIGSFSWFCFTMEGNSLEFLSKLSLPQIAKELGIPASKLSCLMLIDDVIQSLLATSKR
jgi:NifU-like protein involved in Fe-S cluster formation